MSASPIESHPCVQRAASRQGQNNPIQARTGPVGRPSDVVSEGALTTDRNQAVSLENGRIGSDYDHETAADRVREERKRIGWRDGAEGGGL